MSQSSVGAKFGSVLSPLAPANRQLTPSKTSDSFARTAVRKSFKRKLPQQDEPNQNTQPSPTPTTAAAHHRTGTKNAFGPDPPPSVARRNARERNRVKQVNAGFAILRQRIPVMCGSVIVYGGSPADPSTSSPTAGKKNKMSKVETLRCAVEYIRNLERLLATGTAQRDDDCLHYDAATIGECETRENVSPVELGLSGNEDLSGFYDSSSSPESQQSPERAGRPLPDRRFLFPSSSSSDDCAVAVHSKRIKTEEQPDDLYDSFAQLPELLIEPAQHAAIHHAISDQSLLDSLNTWWGASL